MQVIILGAGLGQRLNPLTHILAKPAVRVLNKPLVWHTLSRLARLRARTVFMTLFHNPESVTKLNLVDQFKQLSLSFVMEPELLGTGGGVKNAGQFVGKDEALVVCNGDILWALDLEEAIAKHRNDRNDLTLILTNSCHSRGFSTMRLDEEGRIIQIGSLIRLHGNHAHEIASSLVFTGIYIINTALFAHFPETRVFCFFEDFIVPLMREGLSVHGVVLQGYWTDVGTFERYLDAGQSFTKWRGGTQTSLTGRDCRIAKDAQISNSIIWDNVKIGSGSCIRDSVLIDNVELEENVQLNRTVVVPKHIELKKQPGTYITELSQALAIKYD